MILLRPQGQQLHEEVDLIQAMSEDCGLVDNFLIWLHVLMA